MTSKPKKVPTVNDTLREWREAAGLGLDEAAVEAKRRLGRRSLSRETIRRYETTKPAQDMDGLVLLALVRLYGRAESELPVEAQEKIEQLRELVTMSRWISVHAGQTSLFPDLLVAA